MEKGENAGYQHFLLFPRWFLNGSIIRVIKNRDGMIKESIFARWQNCSLAHFHSICSRQIECISNRKICLCMDIKLEKEKLLGYQYFLFFPQCFLKFFLKWLSQLGSLSRESRETCVLNSCWHWDGQQVEILPILPAIFPSLGLQSWPLGLPTALSGLHCVAFQQFHVKYIESIDHEFWLFWCNWNIWFMCWSCQIMACHLLSYR